MKRALIVPAVVAVLILATGLRAGLVPALELLVIAVALLGGSAYAIYRIGQTQAGRIAAASAAAAAPGATRPVKHCDCCDRACLTTAICEPGPEPLVRHQ